MRRYDFLSKKKEEEETKGEYKTLDENWYRPRFKKRDKKRKNNALDIKVDKSPTMATVA